MSLEQLRQFLLSGSPKSRTGLGKFGVEPLRIFCEEQHLVVQATGRRGRVKADYIKALHAWIISSDSQMGQKRKAREWENTNQSSEPVKKIKTKTPGFKFQLTVQTANRRTRKNKIDRILVDEAHEVHEHPTCRKRKADECIEDIGEDGTEDGESKSSAKGVKRQAAIRKGKEHAVNRPKVGKGDSMGGKSKKGRGQADRRHSAEKKSKRDHSWRQIVVRAFVTRDNLEALKEVTANLEVDGSLNLKDLTASFDLSGELRFVFPKNRYTYKPSSASKLFPEEIRELTDVDQRLGVTFNSRYMS